jgi:hypothetical protein
MANYKQRRSNRELKGLLDRRIAKPVSATDGGGMVYGFIERGGRIKVGRAVDLRRRQRQWDRLCPNPTRKWVIEFWSVHAKRTGACHVFEFRSYIRRIVRGSYASVTRATLLISTAQILPELFVFLFRMPDRVHSTVIGGKRHIEKFVLRGRSQRQTIRLVKRVIRRAEGL